MSNFDEKDHPRGQPNNSGQFVKKGEERKEIDSLPSANRQVSNYEKRFGKSVENAAKELKGVSTSE